MASAENIKDGRYQKHRSKKKIKSQQHAVNVAAVSSVLFVDKTSGKMFKKEEVSAQNISSSNYDERKPINTYSVAVDNSEFHPPEGGRRVSQPLLTIAEEEETAVDPARRRGSTGESRDEEDDDKSAGDTMDMFEDVRLRRKDNNLQRTDNDDEDEEEEEEEEEEEVEDDDDDDEEITMATTDQKDSESVGHMNDDQDNTEMSIGVSEQLREQSENMENARKFGQLERRTSSHDKVTKTDEDSRSRSSSQVGDTLTNNGGKQSVTSSKDSHGGRRQELSTKTSSETIVNVSSERKEVWFAAVTRGDTAAVEKLSSRHRNIVNVVDEHGRTALHVAAEIRSSAMINRLLKSGAMLNIQSTDGETPLHVAARYLDRTTASRLLIAGADSNAASVIDGTTPLHVACQHGDGSRLARLLLRHGARTDVGRRSKSGLVSDIGPLHDAVDSGDVKSVRALLDVDPSLASRVVTDRGCTALHVAARHGRTDVIGELIGRAVGANSCVNRAGSDSRGTGVQPLHMAAENGRPEAVKMLIDAGADVDSVREYAGKTGVTALHLSVIRGHKDVIDILLTQGASVNVSDSEGTTPLHIAARNGLLNVAEVLLERGASTNLGTRAQHTGRASVGGVTKTTVAANQTPLHLAVRHRNADVAKLLLKAGCDVNASESMLMGLTVMRENNMDADNARADLVDSYTALHWSVENGDLGMVRLLLDAGANPDRAASFDAHTGVTPLHLAAQDGYTDIADELLRRGAQRDPRKRTQNRDNVTPLHQAAYNGHPATVAVLVRAGCDVNVQADNGYAAIHYAAQRGDIDMTRYILAAGQPDKVERVPEGKRSERRRKAADISLLATVKDQMDITPLHLAVQSGNVDVIRALIAAGAHVDAGKRMPGGIGGVTALHQAVYQLREDVVEVLLQLGANANRSMNGWYRPLHVAAEKSCASIASRLIVAGAAVDGRAATGDHADLTPLHVAAQHGHSSVVRVLAESGADLTATRRFGDRSLISALHLAAENGFVDTVLVLLEIAATKFQVNSATSASSMSGRHQSPRLSSYVNSQDSMGFTALHLAVQYQFADVVQVLLSAGAEVGVKTMTGLTAYKIANHLPNLIIRDLLRVEINQSFSSTLRTSTLPIPAKSERQNKKTGKLRSLLCGTSRK